MSATDPILIDDDSDTDSSNSRDEVYDMPNNRPHLRTARCPSCHYFKKHCEHSNPLYHKIRILNCFISPENDKVFSDPPLSCQITETKLIPFIDNLLEKFIENIQAKNWDLDRNNYVCYLMANFYMKINRKARELEERYGRAENNGVGLGNTNVTTRSSTNQQPQAQQNVQQTEQTPQQQQQTRRNGSAPQPVIVNGNVIRNNAQQETNNFVRGNNNQSSRLLNHVPINTGQVVRQPQNQYNINAQPYQMQQQFNNASINHFSMNPNGNGTIGINYVNIQIPNMYFQTVLNGLAHQLSNNMNVRLNQSVQPPNQVIPTPTNRNLLPLQLSFQNQRNLFGFSIEELSSMPKFKDSIISKWNLPSNCLISNITFTNPSSQTIFPLNEHSLQVIRENQFGGVEIQFEIYENTHFLPLTNN